MHLYANDWVMCVKKKTGEEEVEKNAANNE